MTTGRPGKLFAPRQREQAQRITMNLFVPKEAAAHPAELRTACAERVTGACRARKLVPATPIDLQVRRKLPAHWKGGTPKPGEVLVVARVWCRAAE